MKGVKEIDDFKDSLQQIVLQVNRCKEITHKLLNFSRKMDSVIKEVAVNRLIDEVISLREHDASLQHFFY